MISGFRKLLAGVALFFLCFVGAADIHVFARDDAAKLHVLDPIHPIFLPAGSSIVTEGDSLTYGMSTAPFGLSPINGSHARRSTKPYPETLAADLGYRVSVINRGYPGDQTIDGLKRWVLTSSGDLTLIMYGTNDCANFGHSPQGVISPESYRAALMALVKRNQQKGAKVVVLTPPPLQDTTLDQRLQSYRTVDAEVAAKTGAYLFDTVEAVHAISDPWVDGIHLKPEAYAAIAGALAKSIKVRPQALR